MKYSSILPLSALIALSLLSWLVDWGILPPGLSLLENLQTSFSGYFYLLIFIIILLESIVYIGFYFPGQFFAVVLVILSKPTAWDIFVLTIMMVGSATLGSYINFKLGWHFSVNKLEVKKIPFKKLLIAMIHMNSLAFFMFSQGANKQRCNIVFLAGLLNLPYYLLLIVGTSLLSEQVMQVAENTWFLVSAVSIWLCIALTLDFKKGKLRG